MSSFPTQRLAVMPTILNVSLNSGGADFSVDGGLSTVGTIAISANACRFNPIYIDRQITALKLFIFNGPAVAGNIDIGIYDIFGNKIVSTGSTAQVGTSVLQIIDITDTTLPPGSYYLAFVGNNGSGQVSGITGGTAGLEVTFAGVVNQTGTFPLPAALTTPASSTSTSYPILGIITSPNVI